MTTSVFYDCTRLLRRLNARHPTGIDRVDLRTLDHLLNCPDRYAVIGVCQTSGTLLKLPGWCLDRLCTTLRKQWMAEHRTSPDEKSLNKVLARTALLPQRVSPIHARAMGRPIHKTPFLFAKRHPNDTDGAPVYLNVSHQIPDRRSGICEALEKSGIRQVFYVHDLIPVTHPEFTRPDHDKRHADRMKTVARFADGVLVNSHDTEIAFKSFCEAGEMTPPGTTVAHIGVEPVFLEAGAVSSMPSPDPVFLALGTLEPRKNHALLLKVWQELSSEADTPGLILVGKRGWLNQATFDRLDRDTVCRNHVTEISDADDTEIVELAQRARAILLPSFAEGWGMVVAEAQALGVPAVVSDLPVFDEFDQTGVIRLSPHDPEAWVKAIRILASAPVTPRLRTARVPVWTGFFETLDTVIGEVAIR